MINSILIRNFQSHKRSLLEFSKGVNVIVGSTDAGKTAILRALRFAVENRPLGKDIQSTWGGETSVTVNVDDNVVVRSKGKKEMYVVNDLELTAFGTSVPKEVQEIFNFSEINLQQQRDNAFLLDETSGNVAGHFNKIANLQKIDFIQSRIESVLRHINQTIGKKADGKQSATGLNLELERTEAKLQKYNHLQKFEDYLEVIENMEVKRNQIAIKIKSLEKILTDIENINKKIKAIRKYIRHEKKVNISIAFIENRDKVAAGKTQLTELIEKIQRNKLKQKKLEKLLTLESLVSQSIEKINSITTIRTNIKKLEQHVNSLVQVKELIKQKQKELKKNQKAFDLLMPDICPLCESKIIHDHEKR